jgi:hypothetical protein
MPKFLVGCHYNKEEFNRHLKKKYRILASPNEWQQVRVRETFELNQLKSAPSQLLPVFSGFGWL